MESVESATSAPTAGRVDWRRTAARLAPLTCVGTVLFEEAAGISVAADDELLQGAKCLLRICLSGDEQPHAMESCVLIIDEAGAIGTEVSKIEGSQCLTEETATGIVHSVAGPRDTIGGLSSAGEIHR